MELLLIFLFQFVFLFLLSRILTRNLSKALFRATKNTELSIRIFHFLFLPGVILHEFSHLISAELMLVKTHSLNLMPVRNGDTLTMGSVEISKTDSVRRAIIGFAPVLIGFLIISLSTFYLLSESSIFSQTISFILIFIIVFEIGNTMFSSRRDLEGTVELVIFFILLFLFLYVVGFDFQEVINFVNSKTSEEILIRGIKIISIPIIIDVVIIALSKLILLRR